MSTEPIYVTIYRSNAYPQKAVHQLFEFQVTKTPNQIVACCQYQTITYQKLNEKANQLDRYALLSILGDWVFESGVIQAKIINFRLKFFRIAGA